MSSNKSFYIIDCSYYFRASFFALPPIYSPSRILVNAVYGFVAMLLKLLKRRSPEALVVADDAHGHYFRHELLPAYKSEKKPVPEECNEQIPILRRVLDAMAVSYLDAKGFEADDIIATLTLEARRNGYYIYICSRDKDLEQLLADDVIILDIVSGKETTSAIMKEKRGVLPYQIPDMLALIGDKVDSIPGISGVGPKTASRLLNIYGTLENVLGHSKELGDRLGTAIRENREQALIAKKIASLRTDVPIPVPFSTFQFRAPDKANVEPLFGELGFDLLLKRLKETIL
jgi:DNA polymerase I